MSVTIYTDASVVGSVATWATVAIVPGKPEPIEAFGIMREPLTKSDVAELRAIANALHKMIARGEIEPGSRVTIRSDNMAAVNRIAGAGPVKVKKRMADAEAATKVIHKIAEVHKLEIVARHVKGHQRQDSPDPHAPFNRRCDYLCRQARKADPKPVPMAKPKVNKAKLALDTARALAGAA